MINKTAPEGNVPLYLFRSGKNSHSYEYMGVHNTVKDGKACTVCRVWAPNAQAVAITGDFCEWDPEKYPLTKIDDAVWEGYTDEPLKEFDAYKLVITAEDGTVTYRPTRMRSTQRHARARLPATTTFRGTSGTTAAGLSTRKNTRIITSR